MTKSDAFLRNIANVLSEELGKETGELFYTSYQNKDKTEVIKDARTLLAELVGPVIAIQKISAASSSKNEK